MTETPKCPYCGAELEVTHAFVNDATAAHKLVYTCFCRECGVYTPKRSTPEEALSAALHRAEPEMRPLTLEEVQKHCEEGVGATPLWMEFIGHDDLSRWMVACIPDIVFEAGNIKLHMDAFGHRYNTMWRCWPRKPTPEQMAAVEWEE
jgi:hypothetical protein